MPSAAVDPVPSSYYVQAGIYRAPLSRYQGMSILLIIIIILLLGGVGTLPTWPHSRSWGYGPSGGLGTMLIILLILYLLHVI